MWAAKIARQIGVQAVDRGGAKEEAHRGFQCLGIHRAGAKGHGNGGDQGRIADDRAHGVAIGDLSVAGQGGGCGNHDLRQRGADGNHRGADDDLRHMEPLGNAGSPVYKPVAAFDQQNQSQGKQKNRYKHIRTLLIILPLNGIFYRGIGGQIQKLRMLQKLLEQGHRTGIVIAVSNALIQSDAQGDDLLELLASIGIVEHF